MCINIEFKQQLTLMHIHMEMGRVTSMRTKERMINIQPHVPMTFSEFSKAAGENKHKHLHGGSVYQHPSLSTSADGYLKIHPLDILLLKDFIFI